LRRSSLRTQGLLWGHISGCRLAGSGHWYFSLKDELAQLKCACFRGTARLLRFRPEDGMAVLARGRLDVYDARGEYQLIVSALEPQGLGALQLAFEQLKRKLEAEGLFAAERKRPLPRYPRRIGVVSSADGAAIRDIVQVLTRRFPGIHVRLFPALVQGAGSVEQMVEGIEYFGRSGWPDVLIVARGGGSLEDLWTFNEEAVARAIAASPVPVVSAVGHETDFTIADFVADLRAPTPSAAAEIVIPPRGDLLERIEGARQRAGRVLRYRLVQASSRVHQLGVDRGAGALHLRINRSAQRVDDAQQRMRDRLRAQLRSGRERWRELAERLQRRDLRLRIAAARGRLDRATAALGRAAEILVASRGARLNPLAARLEAISPLRVLERGYAIVQDEAGHVLRDAAQASAGERLDIRLSRGHLRARVEE
jgi:exodeoxyribonuclease VII large subunit